MNFEEFRYAREVDLKEFERLRDEIDSRTQMGYQLVTVQLAALGTGLSVYDKFPDVLLGLAAASTFLWLFWMDHVSQIHKAALYIGTCLAPRLRSGLDEGLLGWERFIRKLDRGYLSTHSGDVRLQVRPHRTLLIMGYTALLFGGVPFILILLSFYQSEGLSRILCLVSGPGGLACIARGDELSFAGSIGVLAVWVWAVGHFARVSRNLAHISVTITMEGETAGSGR
jgi:hypothetical protein